MLLRDWFGGCEEGVGVLFRAREAIFMMDDRFDWGGVPALVFLLFGTRLKVWTYGLFKSMESKDQLCGVRWEDGTASMMGGI